MAIPEDLKYTKEHEWLRMEGAVAVVGITAFAVEQLGDVVFVDLPKVGAKLAAGGTFGVVESVKSVSDLYVPVSGTVSAINNQLNGAPELVNQEPYGAGWMIRITPDTEAHHLLSAAQYAAHLKELGA